jgi:hypothetical protein
MSCEWRPYLASAAASASAQLCPGARQETACVGGLLELVRVRQIGVRLAGGGHGLVDRAAERKRIEGHVRVGALRPADLLERGGSARCAEIGHGEEAAVTGAHADGIAPSGPCERHDQLAFGPGFAPRLLPHRPLDGGPLRTGERCQSEGAAPHRAQAICAAASPPARAWARQATLSAAIRRGQGVPEQAESQ